MNLRVKMVKLQKAIIHSGLVVKINENQFYSEDQKRIINIYSLTTPVFYYNQKKCIWKFMDYEIMRTSSAPDVILCLADIWKSCEEWREKTDV